ncbi:hypothetical protein DM01DRAFT_1404593 [Hesseltinella vesiculosa]|uniref:Uncharacterized protein n=1 Tax=Hesseltinella vesiculosa TaxID=101127 RepID=A0A1X2GS51_9FUNG|nr:hypothetical protein DM01DRAFT_1404593 [Hesseltinella vesiculosa]
MASYARTFQRRVETVFEEFKRSRKIWDELNAEGFTTGSRLINAVIERQYADDMGYWHPVLRQSFPQLIPTYEEKMTSIIQQEQDKLNGTLDRLTKQYTKMTTFLKELMAIDKRMQDLLQDPGRALFKTCPVQFYVKQVSQIVTMYEQELASKRRIVEGMVDIDSQQQGMAVMSMWLNQSHLQIDTIRQFEEICDVEIAAP